MKTNRSSAMAKSGVRTFLGVLFVLLFAVPAQAFVDRPATIDASGEGAIFDVKATAAGTLRVGTKAGRVGDRWRVTIVQANTNGGVSAVGTGSSTAFSGYVSRAVTANVQYLVIVTWDRPLPGTFPSSVTVRFTGTTDATNPLVVPVNGGTLASIVPRPVRWPEPPAGCPADGSAVGCEALVACELNPAGDTDAFKVNVPANADLCINVAGPSITYWKVFAPNGTLVKTASGLNVAALSVAGSYTIQVYNSYNRTGAYQMSVVGVSTPFRCGPSLIPGGTPVTGAFELGGDTDAYQLNNVLANQAFAINVMGPSITYWKIFDSNGNLIKTASGLSEVKLTTAGGYTLVVYNSYNRTGSYTISVQKVSG